jgi:hypothetical protein
MAQVSSLPARGAWVAPRGLDWREKGTWQRRLVAIYAPGSGLFRWRGFPWCMRIFVCIVFFFKKEKAWRKIFRFFSLFRLKILDVVPWDFVWLGESWDEGWYT